MSCVLQRADDIHFELDATLIRSLHYMLLSYDPTRSPGRWRLGVPERSIPALFNAAQGYRIRNATYRSVVDNVSELVASRDLRVLVEAGLLMPKGERRGRTYLPSTTLRQIEASIRSDRARDDTDPFAVAQAALRSGSLPLWPDAALG